MRALSVKVLFLYQKRYGECNALKDDIDYALTGIMVWKLNKLSKHNKNLALGFKTGRKMRIILAF